MDNYRHKQEADDCNDQQYFYEGQPLVRLITSPSELNLSNVFQCRLSYAGRFVLLMQIG